MTHAPAPPRITVRALVEDRSLHVPLDLVAGRDGLDRFIDHPRIQKSGLALVGHFHGVVPTRVQILGETEMSFLRGLEPDLVREAARGLFANGLSLVIITSTERPLLDTLRAEADAASVPLAVSPERSSRTIAAIHSLLDERLAPRTTLHGVLVDVFGQGLLLLGDSGIGKSECALELVMRGHRLVADDAVLCDWRPPGLVFGSPPEVLRHHIEVRGLGVLNVNHLFGITSVRERKRIDLVIRLVNWSRDTEYDRMGVDDSHVEVLGVPIREVVLPVQPGRSTASIIEIAARNEMVRSVGVHSAREFFARLDRTLVGDVSDVLDDAGDSLGPSDRFAEPDLETPRPPSLRPVSPRPLTVRPPTPKPATVRPASIPASLQPHFEEGERDRESGSCADRGQLDRSERIERSERSERLEGDAPASSVRLDAAVTLALRGELGE